jgi:signal transduction histidine kinase
VDHVVVVQDRLGHPWGDKLLLHGDDDGDLFRRYRREVAASWRPTSWQDWAVPAVLLVGAQLETWLPGAAKISGPRLFFAVMAVIGAAMLVVRRRYALAASLGLCVLFLIAAMFGWFIQSTSLVLMLVMVVFAAGRYGSRPAAYLAVPAASLVALASSAVDPDQGGLAASWPWSLNTVWIFALGAAFRHERTLREQVADTAEAASRAAAAEARVRVARELHDVLSHSLSVVVVQAEVADTFLESDPDKSRQAIHRVANTARAALTDTRRMVGLLREPDAEEPTAIPLGVADVPALVERVRESGVPVTLELSPNLPALTAQATVTAYRVVQESLTNVLRHAGKVPTRVHLAPMDGSLLIDVWDAGGDVAPASSPGGLGLVGMRERVLSCGGEITSGPGPDGGFRVRVVLPAVGTP